MDKMLSAAISESILRYAVIENHKRELAAIPSNEELAKMYTLSDRHETRMKKLFAKEKRREIRVRIFITLKQISTVVVIVTVVLFSALLTNPSVRAAVGQTIIEWYDQFVRFTFNETSVPEEIEEWYPEYLPNGYIESDTIILGGVTKLIEFTNQSGEYINLEYWLADGYAIGVDNENLDFEIVWYNDNEYYVFTAISDDYSNKIVWQGGSDYVFNLRSTTVDVDELMDIAKSLIKK